MENFFQKVRPISWLNHLKFGSRFVQPNFFVSYKAEHFKPVFVRRKILYIWIGGVLSLQKSANPPIPKRLSPKIADPQIAIIVHGRSANLTNFISPHIFGTAVCPSSSKKIHYCFIVFKLINGSIARDPSTVIKFVFQRKSAPILALLIAKTSSVQLYYLKR